MDEYFYKCQAMIPVVVDGIEVGRKLCGNKFVSNIEKSICPKCGNEKLKEITKAFLMLWDNDDRIRYYLTETMDIRSGLSTEETQIAKQIIERYDKKQNQQDEREKETVLDFCI